MSPVDPSRRRFLKLAGVTGGGLVMGVSMTGCGGGGDELPFVAEDGAFAPDAYLQITPDNQVRFYLPRDELGQGSLDGLSVDIAATCGSKDGYVGTKIAER